MIDAYVPGYNEMRAAREAGAAVELQFCQVDYLDVAFTGHFRSTQGRGGIFPRACHYFEAVTGQEC